ncbi:MAG: hypothetical protein GY953_26800 [bacterium]|nr:hypothetical protein [bacterium]
MRDNVAGVEAAVCPSEGGELSSFRVLRDGRWVETIYKARRYGSDDGWRGKAPVLWPATGRNVPEGADRRAGFAYELNGKRLPMPIHGFVRDMPWKAVSRVDEGGAEVRVSVEDTPETRRHYPFGFRLEAVHRLADGRLRIDYTVTAADGNSDRMPFSIGNHITFVVPFVEGTAPERVMFSTPSTIEYIKDPPGLPTGVERPRSLAKPRPLAELEPNAAISLGGYADDPWIRIADPGGVTITMKHHAQSTPEPPVILFNLWGDISKGYYSPEPWVGLQNSLNLRQGLVWLAPGSSWTWTVELEPEVR